MTRHLDDTDLVDQLRDTGDPDALAALYDRHAAPCYGLARRVLANPTAAEDVVQEVFAALWEHPGGYDPGRGPLRRWLLGVTHKKAVDAVRRSAVRAASPLTTGDHPIVPAAGDLAVDNLEAARVRAAWSRLPDDQQEALHLAYWRGHTRVEIARMTSTNEATVRGRIHRAIKRLAAELRTTTEDRRPSYG